MEQIWLKKQTKQNKTFFFLLRQELDFEVHTHTHTHTKFA